MIMPKPYYLFWPPPAAVCRTNNALLFNKIKGGVVSHTVFVFVTGVLFKFVE